MKPLILALVACCGALSVTAAFAAPDYPAPGGAQNKLVESIDSGGGGGGSTAQTATSTAAGTSAHSDRTLDALHDAASGLGGDPSAPAAATPRRPTYRWQSLVPGAIK